MERNTVHLRIKRYFVGEEPVALEQLCEVVGTTPSVLKRLVEEEIIHAQELPGKGICIDPHDLSIVERSVRLHDDLGVNWPGVAIIEQLLGRLEELRHASVAGHASASETHEAGIE